MLYIKEDLGHSSVTTTRIYSHLQPGQKIQSVKKYSDYLAQARRVHEDRQKSGN
jgi:site-specific recombinase XerD